MQTKSWHKSFFRREKINNDEMEYVCIYYVLFSMEDGNLSFVTMNEDKKVLSLHCHILIVSSS